MRYQYFYPEGVFIPQSMIIMGKAYYKGGNKDKALKILGECFNMYTNKPEGEYALFYSGLMRLEAGSYNFAARNFYEYLFIYEKGKLKEEVYINLSLAHALAENYDDAQKKLEEYRKIFPEGVMKDKAEKLAQSIAEVKERPEKSLFLAGLSSAIIPGSGYFYTEKYMLGLFSFCTNAALIYGIYDGYKKNNKFQMIFFSVIEFSFYNYSIVGSVKSADEYNRAEDFKKEVLMGIKTSF
jgi:tetratricopeptide (TPR) repeat protein